MSRIAIFSTAYLPLIGGAEIAVKEITDRIPGVEFDLFCARLRKELPKTERIGRVNVFRIGRGRSCDKYLLPFLGARLAAALAGKNGGYDLIWAIMASYGGLGALFFKLRHPNTPLLLTLQEGDSEEHILKRVGIFYFLWKKIFTKADYIQAISGYLADFGRRHGAKCPVEVVPNGVDISRYTRIRSALQNTQIHAEKSNFLYSDITYKIRGACFKVWKNFQGSFKESIIECALKEELMNHGLLVETQKQIPVYYNNKKVGVYVPDMIINDKIVVELKRKPTLTKEDEKQLWLYLKGSVYKVGLLINFGSKKLEIKRRIYDLAGNSSAHIGVSPKAQNLRLSASTTIITASRLVKKNAVGDIVEAMRYLPESVKLLILGDGPEEHSIKSRISNLKLENRVSLPGAVPHGELPKYLAEADIFIRPSLSEGMGNSFIEAMAAGVPVIGTPVGGIVDFLRDPSANPDETPTGLFCRVRDPQSIAEKVILLLKD
ncbi:MAG: GxxExxY protein, partial [Parcubacteria group bacterium]|nr:GxxExxY protein [Parcubacteria group bacterium]